MGSILYSGIGTTDPVRGLRDGGLMHILRYYRPDTVYLFVSREIVCLDRADNRISKTFDYIRESWDGYAPEVIRFDTEIDDPSDMDALTEPMEALLQRILREHPKSEILLNLSSGTPQMQIILAQMALDPRYPTRGIQVKNPEKRSGTTERTNVKYPVDEALALNEDEEPCFPNRCCEPKMMAVRREAVRNQLNSLVSQRNYAAIAQMGSELPAPIPKLARHLALRSQFRLKEAEEAANGLTGLELHPGREKLPYPIYEMVEYFGTLKNLVYLKQYTDFVLRLNPFLIRLQVEMLDQGLRPLGLTVAEILPIDNGRRQIDPVRIEQRLPALKAFLEKEYVRILEHRDVNIWMLNGMLRFFKADAETLKLLDDCEKLNLKLRNPAAHDLFSVTDRQIQEICGRNTGAIAHDLEVLLLSVLDRYDARGLKKRLTVYERCDGILRTCL